MERRIRRNGTKSSSFGSPGRINHDSSSFYNSKMYDGLRTENIIPYIENPVQQDNLNVLFPHTSEHMHELPDNSIHLMVTSPPYNVGKDYDENLTLKDYRAMLYRVWTEVYRVLVPGGRVAINIANLGRKPYIPLHSYVIEDMSKLNFLMRGEIIWNKASSGSPSTAWGSWLSAKNPILRDIHEYILVFSKGLYGREIIARKKSTISKDEFLEFTKSIWTFSAVSARKIGHPAPFPEELPRRLIQLYTFENDVVLDPFIGSGQAAIAALKTNRYYIGYDTNQKYIQLANKRIHEERLKMSNTELFVAEKKKYYKRKTKKSKSRR